MLTEDRVHELASRKDVHYKNARKFLSWALPDEGEAEALRRLAVLARTRFWNEATVNAITAGIKEHYDCGRV